MKQTIQKLAQKAISITSLVIGIIMIVVEYWVAKE